MNYWGGGGGGGKGYVGPPLPTPMQLGQLKTGQDENLWCPSDLAGYWIE